MRPFKFFFLAALGIMAFLFLARVFFFAFILAAFMSFFYFVSRKVINFFRYMTWEDDPRYYPQRAYAWNNQLPEGSHNSEPLFEDFEKRYDWAVPERIIKIQ